MRPSGLARPEISAISSSESAKSKTSRLASTLSSCVLRGIAATPCWSSQRRRHLARVLAVRRRRCAAGSGRGTRRRGRPANRRSAPCRGARARPAPRSGRDRGGTRPGRRSAAPRSAPPPRGAAPSVKLLTPMWRAWPRLFASLRARDGLAERHVRIGPVQQQQSGSVPSRRTLSSAARNRSSARNRSGQILLVSQISSRGTGERRIAAPTSASLPYICAVSTWR